MRENKKKLREFKQKHQTLKQPMLFYYSSYTEKYYYWTRLHKKDYWCDVHSRTSIISGA